MSILASKEFKGQVLSGELEKYFRLENLAARLNHLTPKSLREDPNIHRLRGASEDIYVLRIRGLRVFLTVSEDNIVILRAMVHG